MKSLAEHTKLKIFLAVTSNLEVCIACYNVPRGINRNFKNTALQSMFIFIANALS